MATAEAALSSAETDTDEKDENDFDEGEFAFFANVGDLGGSC